MSKLPAFQFYPGDWMKDLGVRALSFHDRGVWLEMLCLMHESEQRGKLLLNGNPIDEGMLARILGLDKQILTTTLTNLLTTRVASRDEETGAIMCRRMVRDEDIRKVRAEAGHKGGNPVLLKQNPTTGDKQNPTPSSSSSTSSSEVETKAKDTAPPSAPLAFTLPIWIAPETWKAFEEMRRRIRKPMTHRARELIVAKLGRFRDQGQDAETVLNQSIANGWQDVWPVKDEKGALGGGIGKTRTERNREALAGFIDELRQDAGGTSRGSAGNGKPGNVEVIQPSFSQIRVV